VAAGLSDVGRYREQNEDHWTADPERGVFVVSDGMGGRVAGELASKIVAEVLPDFLVKSLDGIGELSGADAKQAVMHAIIELSELIHRESSKRPDFFGMGATVVLAVIRPPHALLAHVGDSRAYLLRGQVLRQLTKDHSIIQMLIDMGQLAPEHAAMHPARAQITQFVGMESQVFPDVTYLEVQPGDRLLLCSDGLTGMIDDGAIQHILNGCSDDAPLACHALIDAANTAGGKDNITALIIDWQP
jgi:PPM family protein phosphatase